MSHSILPMKTHPNFYVTVLLIICLGQFVATLPVSTRDVVGNSLSLISESETVEVPTTCEQWNAGTDSCQGVCERKTVAEWAKVPLSDCTMDVLTRNTFSRWSDRCDIDDPKTPTHYFIGYGHTCLKADQYDKDICNGCYVSSPALRAQHRITPDQGKAVFRMDLEKARKCVHDAMSGVTTKMTQNQYGVLVTLLNTRGCWSIKSTRIQFQKTKAIFEDVKQGDLSMVTKYLEEDTRDNLGQVRNWVQSQHKQRIELWNKCCNVVDRDPVTKFIPAKANEACTGDNECAEKCCESSTPCKSWIGEINTKCKQGSKKDLKNKGEEVCANEEECQQKCCSPTCETFFLDPNNVCEPGMIDDTDRKQDIIMDPKDFKTKCCKKSPVCDPWLADATNKCQVQGHSKNINAKGVTCGTNDKDSCDVVCCHEPPNCETWTGSCGEKCKTQTAAEWAKVELSSCSMDNHFADQSKIMGYYPKCHRQHGHWYIGYAHTCFGPTDANDMPICQNCYEPTKRSTFEITPEEAKDLLNKDLLHSRTCVGKYIPTTKMTHNQFAVLASLVYLRGCYGFTQLPVFNDIKAGSLDKMVPFLNADNQNNAGEVVDWVKLRKQSEIELWESCCHPNGSKTKKVGGRDVFCKDDADCEAKCCQSFSLCHEWLQDSATKCKQTGQVKDQSVAKRETQCMDDCDTVCCRQMVCSDWLLAPASPVSATVVKQADATSKDSSGIVEADTTITDAPLDATTKFISFRETFINPILSLLQVNSETTETVTRRRRISKGTGSALVPMGESDATKTEMTTTATATKDSTTSQKCAVVGIAKTFAAADTQPECNDEASCQEQCCSPTCGVWNGKEGSICLVDGHKKDSKKNALVCGVEEGKECASLCCSESATEQTCSSWLKEPQPTTTVSSPITQTVKDTSGLPRFSSIPVDFELNNGESINIAIDNPNSDPSTTTTTSSASEPIANTNNNEQPAATTPSTPEGDSMVFSGQALHKCARGVGSSTAFTNTAIKEANMDTKCADDKACNAACCMVPSYTCKEWYNPAKERGCNNAFEYDPKNAEKIVTAETGAEMCCSRVTENTCKNWYMSKTNGRQPPPAVKPVEQQDPTLLEMELSLGVSKDEKDPNPEPCKKDATGKPLCECPTEQEYIDAMSHGHACGWAFQRRFDLCPECACKCACDVVYQSARLPASSVPEGKQDYWPTRCNSDTDPGLPGLFGSCGCETPEPEDPCNPKSFVPENVLLSCNGDAECGNVCCNKHTCEAWFSLDIPCKDAPKTKPDPKKNAEGCVGDECAVDCCSSVGTCTEWFESSGVCENQKDNEYDRERKSDTPCGDKCATECCKPRLTCGQWFDQNESKCLNAENESHDLLKTEKHCSADPNDDQFCAKECCKSNNLCGDWRKTEGATCEITKNLVDQKKDALPCEVDCVEPTCKSENKCALKCCSAPPAETCGIWRQKGGVCVAVGDHEYNKAKDASECDGNCETFCCKPKIKPPQTCEIWNRNNDCVDMDYVPDKAKLECGHKCPTECCARKINVTTQTCGRWKQANFCDTHWMSAGQDSDTCGNGINEVSCKLKCCRKPTCKEGFERSSSPIKCITNYERNPLMDSKECLGPSCSTTCCKPKTDTSTNCDSVMKGDPKNCRNSGYVLNAKHNFASCGTDNSCDIFCCRKPTCKEQFDRVYNPLRCVDNNHRRNTQKDNEECIGSHCPTFCCAPNPPKPICNDWFKLQSRCLMDNHDPDMTKAHEPCDGEGCAIRCCKLRTDTPTCDRWLRDTSTKCDYPLLFGKDFTKSSHKCINDCGSKCCKEFERCATFLDNASRRCINGVKDQTKRNDVCSGGECEKHCCRPAHTCAQFLASPQQCADPLRFDKDPLKNNFVVDPSRWAIDCCRPKTTCQPFLAGPLACSLPNHKKDPSKVNNICINCPAECCTTIGEETCDRWFQKKGVCVDPNDFEYDLDKKLFKFEKDHEEHCCKPKMTCGVWMDKGYPRAKCSKDNHSILRDDQTRSRNCGDAMSGPCNDICCAAESTCKRWISNAQTQCENASVREKDSNKDNVKCEGMECGIKCCKDKAKCDSFLNDSSRKCSAPDQIKDYQSAQKVCGEKCPTECCRPSTCKDWQDNTQTVCKKGNDKQPKFAQKLCTLNVDCVDKCCDKVEEENCGKWIDSQSTMCANNVDKKDNSKRMLPCQGAACATTCCSVAKCKVWLDNSTTRCANEKEGFKKEPKYADKPCKGEACASECCSKPNTCGDWGPKAINKCAQDPIFKYDSSKAGVLCEGEQCAIDCCKEQETCGSWMMKGAPQCKDPKSKPDENLKEKVCKDNCPTVCCKPEETCKGFLESTLPCASTTTERDMSKINTVCNGKNCGVLCCKEKETCATFLDNKNTKCSLTYHEKDQSKRPKFCKGDECSILCCTEVHSCKRFFEEKTACAKPTFEHDPTTVKELCDKEECPVTCCKEKNTCGVWFRDDNNKCTKPHFARNLNKKNELCKGEECGTTCCEPTCKSWRLDSKTQCAKDHKKEEALDFEVCSGDACKTTCCKKVEVIPPPIVKCKEWREDSSTQCVSDKYFKDELLDKETCDKSTGECEKKCCKIIPTCATWLADSNTKCQNPDLREKDSTKTHTKCSGADCEIICCQDRTKCDSFLGDKSQTCSVNGHIKDTTLTSKVCDKQCDSLCCRATVCKDWQDVKGNSCKAGFDKNPLKKDIPCELTGDCVDKCCSQVPDENCGKWIDSKDTVCADATHEKDQTKRMTPCKGDECATSKCCRKATCSSWLVNSATKCVKAVEGYKKDLSLVDKECKGDACATECCSKPPTCKDWGAKKSNKCAEDPNFVYDPEKEAVECEGDDCGIKCCKELPTCGPWMDAKGACPDALHIYDETKRDMVCGPKGCPAACCKVAPTCKNWLADPKSKCANPSAYEKDSSQESKQKRCEGDECTRACCKLIDTCEVFFNKPGSKCATKGHNKDKKLSAEVCGDKCATKCCTAEPTCSVWLASQKCPTDFEPIEDADAVTCEGTDCKRDCCKLIEKHTCKMFWAENGCTEGSEEISSAATTNCEGNNCQPSCCKPVKFDCVKYLKTNKCPSDTKKFLHEPNTNTPIKCNGPEDCAATCCRKQTLCSDHLKKKPCSKGHKVNAEMATKECINCDTECCVPDIATNNCEKFFKTKSCPKGTKKLKGILETPCEGGDCVQKCCGVEEHDSTCASFKSKMGCPKGMEAAKDRDAQMCTGKGCMKQCCVPKPRPCTEYKANGGSCLASTAFKADLNALTCSDDENCKQQCCEPKEPTCTQFFRFKGCPSTKERVDGFDLIECKGADCEEKCCKDISAPVTCTDYLQNSECAEGSEPRPNKDAVCFGTRCQSVCCASTVSQTCGKFFSAKNKCMPGSEALPDTSIECIGSNCAVRCCKPKKIFTCGHFFETDECLSGFHRAKDSLSVPCDEVNGCHATCCKETPVSTCDTFLEKEKCPKHSKMLDSGKLKKTVCSGKKQCTEVCCPAIKPMLCQDFFLNKTCKKGTENRDDVNSKQCFGDECYKDCCKKRNCEEDSCDPEKDNAVNDELDKLLKESQEEEAGPVTCKDSGADEGLCIKWQYGSKTPIPSQSDMNALLG